MTSHWPTPPLRVRQISGFRATRVESIAIAANGSRLFAGTSDGVLTMFEVRGHSPHARTENVELVQISQLLGARSTANRKPVLSLVVVDEWRALLCLADSFLTVYDINTCRQLTQVAETKGAILFSVHEPTRRVVVVTKKKQLLVYGWAGGLSSTGPLVAHGSPISLPDTPLCMCCAGESLVVLGYKKTYVLLDLTSGTTLKLLDTERPGIAIELPSSPVRPPRVLLSSGVRGVFVNLQTRAVSEERLSWSALPLQTCVATPFLVTATERALEIHDLALLRSVQSVPLSGGGASGGDLLAHSLCSTAASPSSPLHDNIYHLNSGASAVTLLEAFPLESVVQSLTLSGRYEEALSLCDLCPLQAVAGGVEVADIHEQYAASLLGVGDFEAAIGHFIQANSPPHDVLLLFPSLVPSKLPLPPSAKTGGKRQPPGADKGSGYASSNAAARASAAVVRYLENQRPQTHLAADEVDRKRRSGGGASWGERGRQAPGAAAGMRAHRGANEAEEDEVVMCSAVMVDTVLLVARLNCSPPRRWDVVDLLSHPNRCHEASCLPLLAERGVSYAEALLWLYRSVGAHERVLQNLTEERCVSQNDPDAWSEEQFFKWTSDYLRTLWHSSNAAEVRLVVAAPGYAGAPSSEPPIMLLLRTSPLLGLRVFLPHESDNSASPLPFQTVSHSLSAEKSVEGRPGLGGLGYSIKEVVGILLQVTPSHGSGAVQTPSGDDEFALEIPLSVKRGLAVAYLEAMISNDLCSAEGHDELGRILIEGLNEETALETDADSGLRRAYSHKLRSLLLESKLYDPQKMLAELPSGIGSSHEKALVLSRLGKHQDVLRLYVSEIQDVGMAEAYCARIYTAAVNRVAQAEAVAYKQDAVEEGDKLGEAGGDLLGIAAALALGSCGDDEEESVIDTLLSSNPEEKRLLQSARDVYLDLVRVYLDDDIDGASPDMNAVVSLLNRHFTRINPVKVLANLPPSTPLAMLTPFLGKAMRHLESQRRTMQVKHGLLKVHFMNISHEVTRQHIEQLSDMAQVPALAKLGSPRSSLPPITLSEHTGTTGGGGGEGFEHRVTCVRHMFESGHVVLQFEVTNQAEVTGQNITGVLVRVVSSDDDLYSVETEIELPFLPFSSTGSCYVVLREKKQTIGAVHTSFSCDLFFDDRSTPLQNLEISTEH